MNQLELEPRENLTRVRGKTAAAIITFWRERLNGVSGSAFHTEDLVRYVRAQGIPVAPASADRVLRDLRVDGRVNYHVTSRSQSLYEALPINEPVPADLDAEIARLRAQRAALEERLNALVQKRLDLIGGGA